MKLISLLLSTIFVTFLSLFVPFLTPLVVIIPGVIILENTILYIIICAAFVSLTYTLSIIILNRIGHKLLDKVVSKINSRLAKRLDYIFETTGYIILLPLMATIFPAVMTILLSFKQDVNYYQFFFYTFLAEILSISLFVSGFTSILARDMATVTIVVLLIYAILIAYTLWYLLYHEQIISKFITIERNLAKEQDEK